MWHPILPPFRKFKKQQLDKIALTSQFIYQIGESPILRQVSSPVNLNEISTIDFKKKIEYLKRCMRRYRKIAGMGRGITAVQVGIPEKFSVIYMPEIKNELLIIINPVITKSSEDKLLYPEMCMSVNPAIAPVVRSSWIEFEYYDEEGIKKTWDRRADDALGVMYNRVLQHEIDHMNGIVNIDLVQSKDIIFESDPVFYKNAKFTKVNLFKDQ